MTSPRIKPSALFIDTMRQFPCYHFVFPEQEAIPNQDTIYRDLPRHIYSKQDATAAGQAIIDNFNPNATNANGDTLLFIAASNGHFEIVKWLVEFGATIDPSHSQNKTPCFIAYEKAIETTQDGILKQAYVKIMNFLVEKGAHTPTPDEPEPALPEQDKEKSDICDQLYRISQFLQLPKWRYGDQYINEKDNACIHTQVQHNLDHLKELRKYLISKGVNCRYATHPVTGRLSLYVLNPSGDQLKEIPVCNIHHQRDQERKVDPMVQSLSTQYEAAFRISVQPNSFWPTKKSEEEQPQQNSAFNADHRSNNMKKC